jgi:hypothetical protein
MYNIFLIACVLTIIGSCSNSVKKEQEVSDGTDITFNGTPYFPIAMYTWCPDIVSDTTAAELDILKHAGFNLIDVKFKDTAQGKYLSFLDRCETRNIAAIIEGNTEAATRGSNDPLFFKAMIENYSTHPALFGFSISDDANNGKYPIADASSLNTSIKKWDKNAHYTICSTYPRYKRADYNAINPAGFWGVTDLLFFQTYPIGSWAQYSNPPEFTRDEELIQNELDCYLLQSYNTENRPWVTTPQTFSWSFFGDYKEFRLPSTDELRNIIYVGLMNGAKGVIYYELHVPSTPYGDHQEVKLYDNDSLWAEIKAINAEIKTLQNVLMFGKRTKFITLSWTAASCWTHEGKTYVVVANLHKSTPQSVEYKIGASGSLSNLFENRKGTLSYSNGILTGQIAAKQVQVYRIE